VITSFIWAAWLFFLVSLSERHSGHRYFSFEQDSLLHTNSTFLLCAEQISWLNSFSLALSSICSEILSSIMLSWFLRIWGKKLRMNKWKPKSSFIWLSIIGDQKLVAGGYLQIIPILVGFFFLFWSTLSIPFTLEIKNAS